MLQTIKKLLLGIVNDIDAGNSNIDEKEALKIVEMLKGMRKDNPMSKYQAYTYLGISRAKFDNLVRDKASCRRDCEVSRGSLGL